MHNAPFSRPLTLLGGLFAAALASTLAPAGLLAQTAAEAGAAAPVEVPDGVVAERVDLEVIGQIRDEGLERSHLPELARYVNDVLGPRLTASPAMRRANRWAADRLREWGLSNVVIEPWGEFGRGWERVSYSGRILTPFVQPLHAQPAGWTGSTDGTVRGPAIVVEAETADDLESQRGRLAGAWILAAEPPEIRPEFEWRDRRLEPEQILDAAEPTDRGDRPRMTDEQRARMRERYMQRRRLEEARDAFLFEEGAAGILRPSSRPYGILRSASVQSGRDPERPDPLPQLVVSQEQYGQIHRNVTHGVPVELEIEVQNRFYSEDLNAYNVLGDLPGSDRADEYVMLGAHWDSWYMGTGATDNSAGSLVMMEAMRILMALDLQPRRTIRIALWSGEEQGLLGSRGWLENHPESHDRIAAYLNLDNGTGRLRGIYSQENRAAIPIFEQLLWPFKDLGVVGVWDRNTGGTDHLSFDAAGVPGFNFVQDPIEYSFRTHHTYVDTYDHLLLDDLKQAAVVVASTVYHLAMRDEMMPRKVEETVP